MRGAKMKLGKSTTILSAGFVILFLFTQALSGNSSLGAKINYHDLDGSMAWGGELNEGGDTPTLSLGSTGVVWAGTPAELSGDVNFRHVYHQTLNQHIAEFWSQQN